MHKTTLLVFMTILFFCGTLKSQDFDLENYFNNHLHLSDQQLMAEALDSLQNQEDENLFFHEFQLTVAPNNLFKIFSFHGEGCGAYCNPHTSVIIVFPNHNIIRAFEDKWAKMYIDSILSFDPERNRYLIFGHQSGRPRGIESNNCNYAYVVEYNESYLKTIWSLESCTSNLAYSEEDDEWVNELKYDEAKKEFVYTFRWYDEFNWTSFKQSGTWKYHHGEFIEIHKSITEEYSLE